VGGEGGNGAGEGHRGAALFVWPGRGRGVCGMAEPVGAPCVTLLGVELLQVLDGQLEVLEVSEGALRHSRSIRRFE